MNIDFHYYATFLAARIAGFDKSEAKIIAHSAQYVDESTSNMIDPQLHDLLAESPQPTVMSNDEYVKYYSNPLAGWSDSQLTEIQRAWMPFHFLPGNLDYKINYQGKTSDSSIGGHWELGPKQKEIFKLLCTTNSNTVEFMINDTRKYYDEANKNLHMIGLRMHVLSDTWTHKYHIGRPEWFINDAGSVVEEFDGGSWNKLDFNVLDRLSHPSQGLADSPSNRLYFAAPPMATYNGIVYLGHARMGHLPDYGYLIYKYSPQWKSNNDGSDKIIEKNNHEDFMCAFRQLVYALTCIRNNKPFSINEYASLEVNNTDVSSKVQAVINTRKIDQSEDWNQLIGELYGKDEKISDFDKDEWKKAFIATNQTDKKNTDYYLFNEAAINHRNSIEGFLNKSNLSL